MANFGLFRAFSEKLFEGELPINLGMVQSDFFQGLLDFYPNAAVAYSLRLLRQGYTGSAIEVRNNSGTHLDIGFVGAQLDTATLLTHCAGGNGTVSKWYDQSGNNRDLTQSTVANQPLIVSSGSLILQNSKPSLKFDGVNDFLQSPNTVVVNGLSNLHYYTVVQTIDTSINNQARAIYYFGETSSWGQIYLALAQSSYFAQFGTSQTNSTITGSITTSTLLRLTTLYKNTTTDFLDINNTNIRTATGKLSTIANTNNFFQLGRGLSDFANCHISEFIFYPTNQIANNSAINSNINSFYSIY